MLLQPRPLLLPALPLPPVLRLRPLQLIRQPLPLLLRFCQLRTGCDELIRSAALSKGPTDQRVA